MDTLQVMTFNSTFMIQRIIAHVEEDRQSQMYMYHVYCSLVITSWLSINTY